ncbi:hypothetical protein DJ013_21055 [Arcticibacterium luteifluviistationis]|uniref:Uncharacterized protein n=1 Tax=Arcticibacterium luteifluviistationis TaxID=1784714 RepID=A0A2Z4GHV1_9BACT|nr:hypothetical protein DJ013_21055 [Arcticibacterium luteifluviistationis]
MFVGAAVTSCSTSKTLVSNGEYDDMYGTSSDAPVAYAPTVSKSSEAYSPEYLTDYNDAYDRMPVETSVDGESVEGTDTYFDENYVSANSLKRAYTPDAGYTSGYAEGYAEGWNDYAWSGSRNLNSWNSFNNPFGGGYGYNSFGYSPFNSGFGSYLGMGSLAYGGFYGINSFGSSRFGMNSFGYSPYGYNSFGYSPWGYSSYGMYSAYGNGYGNSYYGVQPVLASDSRFAGSRSYGPRSSSGRASSLYNDGFVNTRKPVTTANSARRATGTSTTGSRSAIASRANGRTYTSASSRPSSYDAYTRSSARSVSTRSASNSGLSRTATSPRSSANTYSRTATRARSYTPSSSSTGTSRNSSSTPTRTNSTYSSAATSTRSSSPSTGSYSRGSSSSSSSSSRSSSSARPR